MTLAARRAATVAASLAAVGVLAACGTGEATDAVDTPTSSESSAEADAEATDTADATDSGESAEGTDASESSDAADSSESSDASEGAGTYADGSYTATGSYISPGGEESIEVTLTLSSDVVTDVEVVSLAKHPNSELYQGKFIDGISDVVVGVAIDDLAVDKVAGSSLTSGGFNEAVDLIKDEARA